jgi:hypothetical protein
MFLHQHSALVSVVGEMGIALQFAASVSKRRLSAHCIAIAEIVAYSAQILGFLQRHDPFGTFNLKRNTTLQRPCQYQNRLQATTQEKAWAQTDSTSADHSNDSAEDNTEHDLTEPVFPSGQIGRPVIYRFVDGQARLHLREPPLA